MARGQGQEQLFRGQTLSGPRTGMLEAKVKTKDQGHKYKCSKKKGKKRIKVFKTIFEAISKENEEKVLKNFF